MQGLRPTRMRHNLLRWAAIALLLASAAGAGSAIVAVESASGENAAGEKPAGESPAPARKVLVVAKIREEAKRRALEEEARAELKKRGVETLLGSDVTTDADFASEDAIRSKVESLGVDGVLGFVVLGVDETVKTTSASISVGVGGYGGGGFGMFVGASAPIGGSTKIVRTVHLRSRFWARPFATPAWEKVYNEKLQDDTTRLTYYLAQDSIKTLKKKKLIPAK
jgi:hypothetical protein